ncbi:hypothetical protein KBY24_14705 [Ruegeria pomeroyi]|nr:hypothetical protein [Ruegeria pomeroyi]MCE8534641.1 hypothetical protein [Ruegeria pomeroyi]
MKLIYLAVPALIAHAGFALAQSSQFGPENLATLDSDGDETVSKAEYDAFVGFAFETMDKDNSGDLSPDEVDDYVAGDAFRMLDDDGNGLVSLNEFSAEMEEDFSDADQDGDGILD